MIPVSLGVKVWLETGHTDMRKGFASLVLLAHEVLKRDPLGGHVFCFRGRRGDLLKVIWLAGDGSAQPSGAIRVGSLYMVAYIGIDGRLRAWRNMEDGSVPTAGLVLSAARDPLLLELAPGCWTVWTNTATGRTSIRANLSGVLVDLLNDPAF